MNDQLIAAAGIIVFTCLICAANIDHTLRDLVNAVKDNTKATKELKEP